jgi:hypothetical protein
LPLTVRLGVRSPDGQQMLLVLPRQAPVPNQVQNPSLASHQHQQLQLEQVPQQHAASLPGELQDDSNTVMAAMAAAAAAPDQYVQLLQLPAQFTLLNVVLERRQPSYTRNTVAMLQVSRLLHYEHPQNTH